jgi:zinc protease
MEAIGGFGGKAASLNWYYFGTGDPDYFAEDLARYRAVTTSDVQRVVQTYLLRPKVIVSVVPEGQRALAATPVGAAP